MPDPKNPNDMPMPAPTWKAPVEEPESEQLPDEKRDPNPDENREPPMQMAGTSRPSEEALKNPLANRDAEGPRKAGMTPRPTDRPLG